MSPSDSLDGASHHELLDRWTMLQERRAVQEVAEQAVLRALLAHAGLSMHSAQVGPDGRWTVILSIGPRVYGDEDRSARLSQPGGAPATPADVQSDVHFIMPPEAVTGPESPVQGESPEAMDSASEREDQPVEGAEAVAPISVPQEPLPPVVAPTPPTAPVAPPAARPAFHMPTPQMDGPPIHEDVAVAAPVPEASPIVAPVPPAPAPVQPAVPVPPAPAPGRATPPSSAFVLPPLGAQASSPRLPAFPALPSLPTLPTVPPVAAKAPAAPAPERAPFVLPDLAPAPAPSAPAPLPGFVLPAPSVPQAAVPQAQAPAPVRMAESDPGTLPAPPESGVTDVRALAREGAETLRVARLGLRRANPLRTGGEDPAVSAQRRARTLVGDIVAYRRADHTQALKEGPEAVARVFASDIAQARDNYNSQVPESLESREAIFIEAVNRVLGNDQIVLPPL